jgi:hypothetical protein
MESNSRAIFNHLEIKIKNNQIAQNVKGINPKAIITELIQYEIRIEIYLYSLPVCLTLCILQLQIIYTNSSLTLIEI